jgi:uracil-DNA glycosylase
VTGLDLSRLGAWADLPFWAENLPAIEDALRSENRRVFPPPDRVFAALERTQPDAVRVVILGQDPYHTPGKADGLAFSIPQNFGGRLDSLRNIFRELQRDLNVVRTRTVLTDWADQGILLLNPVLTVPQGAPKAHAGLGWEMLTQQVIARLGQTPRAFVLWGNPAHAYAPPDGAGHLVLKGRHPSPLSAHRGFFGSRPFSTVNAWLTEQGQAQIDWAGKE